MASIKCPQCGLTNWDTAISCKRCSLALQQNGSNQTFQSYEQTPFQPENNFVPAGDQYQTGSQNWSGSQTNYQSQTNSYYQPPRDVKQGLAIASMVMGIVGCFLTAIPGLIMGISAFRKAKREPEFYGGKGFAIAGICLNIVQILAIPLIAAIAIPNLLAARRSANEAAAISTIRKINSAEMTYQATVGQGNFGDLSELAKSGLIDSAIANGQKSGYLFKIVVQPSGLLQPSNYEVTAVPLVEKNKGVTATGNRTFYSSVNDNGQIHASNVSGMVAKSSDPVIGQDYETPQRQNQPSQISTNPRNQLQNP